MRAIVVRLFRRAALTGTMVHHVSTIAGRSWGIGLFAPAGFVTDPDALERAISRLRAAGHHVVVDPTCDMRWQRFAGADDERAAAVHRMAENPEVELAIAVRGGYGWSRLLEKLDYRAIADSGKRWLGHSDFTAFQLAALAKAGMVTYAGPMAAYDLGAIDPSPFTLDHCSRLLSAPKHSIECALGGPDLSTSGRLWGGNLALVTHLVGTPYLPAIDNGILFLEDIGESPYRIERMLYQLAYAGVLERQSAVLLGAFNGFELGRNDNGFDLETLVTHIRSRFSVPIHVGLPFGHVPDKLTLPVGGRCDLSVRSGRATLTFGDYAPTPFRLRVADWATDESGLREIRQAVFVVEQHVPEDLEWDDLDATARHVIAEDDSGAPIGCARLLPDGRIGRVAVVERCRTLGVGAAIMRRVIELARVAGHGRAVLAAQTYAIPFYERFGFVPHGSEFDDAGIPHREMELALPPHPRAMP